VSHPRGRVLIVDDEVTVRKALEAVLRPLSFDVASAGTGEEAITLVRTFRYDAVLLDVILPGISGVNTCRELRALRPKLGILMVTVYDNEEMIIQALDAGADDYITKPFHVGELAARLRAVIRRSRAAEIRNDAVIAIGEIELDPARRTVTRAGEFVHLTPKEFDLLQCLMLNAGFPISHSRLLGAVWGPEYGREVEYLRTFVRQLRRKLENDAAQPRYLVTISHVGYLFKTDSESHNRATANALLNS
jgi:two-component system KDP operon response regulator KdpE